MLHIVDIKHCNVVVLNSALVDYKLEMEVVHTVGIKHCHVVGHY